MTRTPPVARRRHRGAPGARRGGARRGPGARPARVPRLRGQGRRRDVELEAGEDDARGALERRRDRHRRPSQRLPAARTTSPSASSRARCSTRPSPDEATRARELALRAVRARGALTEAGIVEHWRMRGGAARIRPHVDALVAEGVLERVRVEDGDADVLVPSRSRPRSATSDRGGAPLPVRQPALGSAVRAPRPRLRPRHRGLQARRTSGGSATTSCRSSGATASSGAPT